MEQHRIRGVVDDVHQPPQFVRGRQAVGGEGDVFLADVGVAGGPALGDVPVEVGSRAAEVDDGLDAAAATESTS